MEQIYIFTLVVLFVLAVFDLMVGVSNDAANFLNSAVGSKVTTIHTIMIVANTWWPPHTSTSRSTPTSKKTD